MSRIIGTFDYPENLLRDLFGYENYSGPPTAEIQKALDQALSNLKFDKQREIIQMRFVKRMTYHEIADILGLSVTGVKNRLDTNCRILRRSMLLRQLISEGNSAPSPEQSPLQLFWVSYICQETENSSPWRVSLENGCVSIEKALSSIQKARNSNRVLSAWIDMYDENGEKTGTVFHECYLNSMGKISQ